MTDTVLVIGGTGQLGAPVVGQLRGDGYRVRYFIATTLLQWCAQRRD
jgi:nucleoside-diphosphate-sugar epimerase